MNSAKYVDQLIEQMKAEAVDVRNIAWQTALACVGWPYVFGAWGAECTVAERHKRYRDAHPTIRTKCKAYDGGSCDGCKWYPGGERVRCYDCRGFTDWILKVAGIIDLQGEGATSQWNTEANWEKKGTVAEGIPQDVIVCLFYPEKTAPKKMAHTGLYFNGETVECSSGVQHSSTLAKKWTHWAVPKGQPGGSVVPPAPQPEPQPDPDVRPTLRRGSKGQAVAECQMMLDKLGYDLGSCGIDGDYGRMTECAVMNFQADRGLNRDGVCGPKTWTALIAAAETFKPEKKALYSVTIPHMTKDQATALVNSHAGAYMAEEGVS